MKVLEDNENGCESCIQGVPFKALLGERLFLGTEETTMNKKPLLGLKLGRRVETVQIKHMLPSRGAEAVQKTGDAIREEVGKHFKGASGSDS